MASPHQNSFENGSCLPCADWNNLWEGNTVSQSHPTTDSSVDGMKQTEDMLSNQLNKLSLQERSEAYDDVHCVGDELKETPEMIQESLLEFERAIPKYRNAEYDIALKQNKAYVEDESFRLKFLRAQMHNVDKAVKQMMSFLHYKGYYFGVDKLARDITLADLSEEDKKLMLSGMGHFQAGRDRMGRHVVYCLSKMVGRYKPEATYRVVYHMWYNILIAQPEVQMKGVVEVFFATPRPEDDALDLASDSDFRKLFDAFLSLPVRNTASHYCVNKAEKRSLIFESVLVALRLSGFSPYSQVRTRVHYGTVMELQYQLRGYGIPLDTFPVHMNGKAREDILNVWFYEHQTKEGMKMLHGDGFKAKEEDQSSNFFAPLMESPLAPSDASQSIPYSQVASVATPSENDVLSGRGRFFQDHPGNVRFRSLLEERRDEYDKLGRHERMIYTIRLTNLLGTNNIRFLKLTGAGDWVTLDASEVRKKISQQFRTLRKKK